MKESHTRERDTWGRRLAPSHLRFLPQARIPYQLIQENQRHQVLTWRELAAAFQIESCRARLPLSFLRDFIPRYFRVKGLVRMEAKICSLNRIRKKNAAFKKQFLYSGRPRHCRNVGAGPFLPAGTKTTTIEKRAKERENPERNSRSRIACPRTTRRRRSFATKASKLSGRQFAE